jgi:iron complex transport system substrate-binding protein
MGENMMKKNKILKVLSVALLSITMGMSLASCGNKAEKEVVTDSGVNAVESVDESAESTEVVNEPVDEYYPITYTTYNHSKEPVEVTIEKAPTKVVAVYQNSIETLLALGLEEKIVAAAGLDHKVKPEFEEAFSSVNYLDDWQPNKETVVMLEPDFILSWYSYFGEKRLGDVDYFHNNNIGTYMALNSGAVSPRTLQNECDDILNIGKIFNVNEKAEVLVDEIKSRVSEVLESQAGKEQKSTLIIEFYTDKISGYGASSLGGDMVVKLGAELLNPEGNDLGIEDIIALDPDSIFVVYYNGGKRTDEEAENGALRDVMDNEALANISAVKNGKVYAIPLGEMYASGVRTIDGIERFAKGIYE